MSNLKTKTDTLKVYHVIEPKDDYEYVITNYAFHAKNMCDAYDKYGQRIGCELAGCYSPYNPYTEKDFCEDREDLLLELLQAKFESHGEETCDSIKEYKATNEDLYYEVLNEEFIKEDCLVHLKSYYETFWNGHNHVSVFIDDNETDIVMCNLEEISNEEEKEILDDLKNSVQQDYSKYGELHKGKKYEFLMSYAQDAWETYKVRKLADEE